MKYGCEVQSYKMFNEGLTMMSDSRPGSQIIRYIIQVSILIIFFL